MTRRNSLDRKTDTQRRRNRSRRLPLEMLESRRLLAVTAVVDIDHPSIAEVGDFNPAEIHASAPTGELVNPTAGSTVAPFGINSQQYIELTFDDVSHGVDISSINGNELTISGAGVGTAVLDGTATLVSGTTFRFGFTGEFVDGEVTVNLLICTFKDLGGYWNGPDSWSFTVETPPPLQTTIVDDGDAGFSTTGSWVNSVGGGHQRDVHYSAKGNGADVATWTLTGLPGGRQYQVSATWSPFVNRATDAHYRILDGTTEVFSTTANQRIAPLGDVNASGTNFQHLGVVTINSGTMVIELLDDANGYVIADAVLVSEYSDLAAPTVQINNPVDGAAVTPDGLNSQGYIEVTFDDVGAGVDTASINGDEITLSGSGMGTAVLDGSVTLVSGTTCRYGFTGAFVDGNVSVDLVAGSFQDMADTPNMNAAAAWSFAVQSPPAFQTTIIDNGDTEFSTTGSWVSSAGGGHQNDVHYSAGGNGADVATWTLTGLPVGQYQVSSTWSPFVNRATNAPYRILDGTTEVFSTTVNQRVAPLGDVNASGTNFQHLGIVTISSGTLVIELSDDANGYVIADAVLVADFIDHEAPTAQISNPVDGAVVTLDGINSQGYIDVTFDDAGEGLDTASIDGNEIAIGGAGMGTATLDGTATLVSGTTYRYSFSGAFVDGNVSVDLVAGSLQDLAGTPNLNAPDSWSFTVESPPPFQTTIIDNGDAEFNSIGSWVNSAGAGHQSDVHYSAAGTGADVATWTLTGLPVGQYQVSATWTPFVNRATNAPYRILDGTTEVFATTVNQRVAPLADASASGTNFQHLGVVTINSGTLVIELTDNANYYVIADAVRIEDVSPPLVAALEVLAPQASVIPSESAEVPPAELAELEVELALLATELRSAAESTAVVTSGETDNDTDTVSDSLFADLGNSDSDGWHDVAIEDLDLLASHRW